MKFLNLVAGLAFIISAQSALAQSPDLVSCGYSTIKRTSVLGDKNIPTLTIYGNDQGKKVLAVELRYQSYDARNTAFAKCGEYAKQCSLNKETMVVKLMDNVEYNAGGTDAHIITQVAHELSAKIMTTTHELPVVNEVLRKQLGDREMPF